MQTELLMGCDARQRSVFQLSSVYLLDSDVIWQVHKYLNGRKFVTPRAMH